MEGEALTDAEVGVDGREQRCPDTVVRVLPVRYVFLREWIPPLLGKPEVDDIDEGLGG